MSKRRLSRPIPPIWMLSFLVLSFFACGCGDPNRAKIVGDWEIAKADKVSRRSDAFESEEADEGPKMLVRFYRSGVLETQTNMGRATTKKKGRWKFLSFEEASNTVTISCDLMDQSTEHPIILVDDNTIRLVPPNLAGLKKKIDFVRRQ